MTAPATRRRLSADDRRAEILDAARQLFATNGYDATTTREIARAADMSDALLYRHFANKHEVLDQVIDRAIAAFSALPPIGRLQDLPTDALLRAIGTVFLERVAANVDLITILVGEHAAASDPRFAAFIDGAATALGDDLARRAPGMSPEDGYLNARSFFGSLISFVLLQSVLGMDAVRPTPPDEYLDHLVAVYAGGSPIR
jgi:AcrR family transcriptional regulator